MAAVSAANESRRTISRGLQRQGSKTHAPASNPLISKRYQKARPQFAQEHVAWTEEQWSKVQFSDESKLNEIAIKTNHVGLRFNSKLKPTAIITNRGGNGKVDNNDPAVITD